MTATPAGQVTFLFTDIEGSTRLLARVGRRYPAMVERHRAIIAAVVTRHGGSVAPQEGDACLATFAVAAAAVTAAVDIQRALASHDWRDEPLRVRIGVHSGRAMFHDGEYFGLDLHRVARMAGAGHGGQVLVSEATRSLVDATPPADVGLVDLGVHRLRDLEAPVRLYQAQGRGLVTDFPPLRALRRDAHNLPAQRTSLVGREGEVAAVTGVLRRHRLVTLTGPGGIGKTRLALHTGAAMVHAFPDGVWFVELTRASEATAVPAVIASALGVDTADSTDPVAVIADALRDASTLLILDNAEHVIDAAGVIGALLQTTVGLHVLATSRERLLLTGEQVYEVPALGLARHGEPEQTNVDAVTLFIERARGVMPSFDPTTGELRDIAEICGLVDGLPLAIELAAAQTRVLSVRDIRQRMREGLDALGGGERDRPARHRTMRDTITWSVRLLPPDERRLFVRLAVFQGERTLDAIAAVCVDGLAVDAMVGVTALVDKSLLHRRVGTDGKMTFEMLALIHEFASEALEAAADAAAVRHRHARYFLELAERADAGMLGHDAPMWEGVLNTQLNNIRHALAWAFGDGDRDLGVRLVAALNLFWYWGGPHHDGRQWVRDAFEHAAEFRTPTRGRLHVAAGFFGFADGDLSTARRHWQLALAAFEPANDAARSSWMLSLIAVTYAGVADRHDEALALADRAVRLGRAHGRSHRVVADALTGKGEIARTRGDDALARRCYEEALAIVEPAGNVRYIATLKANLAFIADHEGAHGTALDLLRDALATSWKEGYRLFVARMLGELAAPELGLGRPERAARLVGASDAALQRFGVARQPADRPEHERTVARLSDVLGPARMRELAADGARMSLDRAVDVALAESRPAPTAGS